MPLLQFWFCCDSMRLFFTNKNLGTCRWKFKPSQELGFFWANLNTPDVQPQHSWCSTSALLLWWHTRRNTRKEQAKKSQMKSWTLKSLCREDMVFLIWNALMWLSNCFEDWLANSQECHDLKTDRQMLKNVKLWRAFQHQPSSRDDCPICKPVSRLI